MKLRKVVPVCTDKIGKSTNFLSVVDFYGGKNRFERKRGKASTVLWTTSFHVYDKSYDVGFVLKVGDRIACDLKRCRRL